jgi:hypothetical protein
LNFASFIVVFRVPSQRLLSPTPGTGNFSRENLPTAQQPHKCRGWVFLKKKKKEKVSLQQPQESQKEKENHLIVFNNFIRSQYFI